MFVDYQLHEEISFVWDSFGWFFGPLFILQSSIEKKTNKWLSRKIQQNKKTISKEKQCKSNQKFTQKTITTKMNNNNNKKKHF